MGLGVARPDEQLFAEVMGRYAEPHRSYHTTRHLDECFAKLDEARQHADRFYEIELALWFHDAVYDVRASDNEERSASWAQAAMSAAGLDTTVDVRVRDLILATRHDVSPPAGDAALLVDVDLAISARRSNASMKTNSKCGRNIRGCRGSCSSEREL